MSHGSQSRVKRSGRVSVVQWCNVQKKNTKEIDGLTLMAIAYLDTGYYIFLPALILSVVPLLAGLLTTNFKLDDRHNAVESKEQVMRGEEETSEDVAFARVAGAQEKARRNVQTAAH